MLKDYQLQSTENDLLVEGFNPLLAEQANAVDVDAESWAVITGSRQNRTVLQTEVIGLEEAVFNRKKLEGGKVDEQKALCAVIEVGTLTGYIPVTFLGVEEKKAKGLIGLPVVFVVIALDKASGYFVGSRVEAINIMASRALKKLKPNDVVTGVIRQIFPSNMLVDVGGITASIPASEVSYAWVDSLRDHYTVDQHVKVKITAINVQEKSVKASIKALLPDPFLNAVTKYKQGGQYVGKVSGVVDFGVYVTLREGVSGLAEFPEGFVVEKGDKVIVRFGKVEKEKRHINLRLMKKL